MPLSSSFRAQVSLMVRVMPLRLKVMVVFA